MTRDVNLFDICSPKQWKTIASSQLHDSGYPVYGANGKIGFYSEYTHEAPTLLITCRGATCGVLNICEPYSYVNGNAMALDNLSESMSLKFLYHFLNQRGFEDVISGSAQPQITRQGLQNIKVPQPPIHEQEKIARILDAADELRQKDQRLIDHYTALGQALFIEMFGDPVANPKGWIKRPLSKIVNSVNDCPHTTPQWTDSGIVAIRTSNLSKGGWCWDDKRYVSEAEFHERSKRAYVNEGDIVLSREGTIGVLAIVEKGMKICLGQRLVQLVPNLAVANNRFLLHQLLIDLSPENISHVMVGATSKHLNVKELREMAIPIPPIELQNQFAERIALIEAQKQQAQASLAQSQALFDSLLHRAFTGELTA